MGLSTRPLLLKALRLPVHQTGLLSLLIVFATVALGSNLAQVAQAEQTTTQSQNASAGRATMDVQAISNTGLNAHQVSAVMASPLLQNQSTLQEKASFAIAATNPESSVPITLVGESAGSVALRPLRLAAGALPTSCRQIAMSAALLPILTANRLSTRSLVLPGTDGLKTVAVSGLISRTQTGVAAPPGAVYMQTSCIHKNFSLGLRTLLVAARLAPGHQFKPVSAALLRETGNGVVISDPGAATTAASSYQIFGLITEASLLFGILVTIATTALLLGRRRRVLETLILSGVSRRTLQFTSLELAARFSGTGVAVGALLLIPVDSVTSVSLGTALTSILESAVLIFLTSTVTGALASLPLQGGTMAGQPEPEWKSAPWLGAAGILLTVAGITAVQNGASASQLPGAMAVLLGTTLAVAAVLPYVSHPGLHSTRWLTQLLALRSMWLRPRRTMLSLALVMVSVSTTVGITSLTTSELSAAANWVHELFPGQAVVVSPVPEPLTLATTISSTAGVASSASISEFTAATAGRLTPFIAVSPTGFGTGTPEQPQGGSSAQSLEHLNQPDTAVAPEQLAAASGWKVSENIVAEGPNGKLVQLRLVGILAHTFPGGGGQPSMIVSTATAKKLGAPPTFNDIAVSCATAECISSSRQTAARYGWALITKSQLTDATQALVGQDMGRLAIAPILLLLATVVAVFAVNWNNAQDQEKEFFLLKTVGMTRAGLASLIWWQSVLISGLGGVLALAAGVLLSAVFIQVSSTPALELAMAIPPAAFLPALVLVLAGVCTALIPSRVLSSQSISDSLDGS